MTLSMLQDLNQIVFNSSTTFQMEFNEDLIIDFDIEPKIQLGGVNSQIYW